MTLKTAIPEINAHQRKLLLRMVLECLPSQDYRYNRIDDFKEAIDEATANLIKLIQDAK